MMATLFPCPQYLGTVVAENSPKAVRRLPTLYWYVSENKEYGWEWYRAAYNAHIRSGLPAYTFSDKGTYASIFYDGMLYDNVAVRVRGAGSLAYTKKGLQFVLNPDFEFRLHGYEMGRYTPQGTTFKQFNLTTTGADESYVRQPLAWAAYALTHVPYSVSFPMRIEQNGSFFSVAAFVEQPDSRYLRRQGFDLRGTLFQVYQSSLSLNHINGSSDPTSGVDQIRPKDADRINALHDFIQGINVNPANTLGGRQRITGYLFDHVDIPELINYMATRTAINDWDTTWHNYYLFQDAENGPNPEAQPRRGTDEWRILPWDKDTVLDTTHPGYPRDANHPYFGSHGYAPVPNALYSAVIEDPTLRSMYLRRLRSVMDLLYGTGDTEYWLLEQAGLLSSDTAKDAQLDSRRWATAGAYKTDVPVASFDPKELPRQIQKRKQELFSGSPNGFAVLIPLHERIRQVYFGSVVSGLLPIESAVTVVNCGQDAADLSGWTLSRSGIPGYVFPAGVVIPAQGRLYLAPDARAFRDSLRRLDKVAALGLFVNGGFDADLLFGKEFPSLRGGVILSDGSQTVASTNSPPAACAAAYLPAIIR